LRDIERLGREVEWIIRTLYNAVLGKPGENITPPVEVTASLIGPTDGAREFNEGIRDSAEIAANADKGFVHYLKYFRQDQPVSAAIRVEAVRQGEHVWGVYFEQGRHRMVLSGTVLGTDEEAIWTAWCRGVIWTAGCAFTRLPHQG
jgi:hypothetical protein